MNAEWKKVKLGEVLTERRENPILMNFFQVQYESLKKLALTKDVFSFV